MSYSGILKKQEKIRNGEISLEKNVRSFFEKINRSSQLNAFNSLNNSAAEQAELIEEKIKSGKANKLAGMVISVKDILAVKGLPMTCSSEYLKNFTAVYTAEAIKRLQEEDAIIIGKTNCDEFAMGSSNENSAFGPVLNPYDNQRTPGGSSGGAAVSVAAGLCDAAIGTDTGGSIRQPAAFTGVFGLKPTYGRVSRYGLTAFASSFDTIGPITSNVTDAALLLEVISGSDTKDSTSVNVKKENFIEKFNEENRFTIGIPEDLIKEGVQKEIIVSLNNLIDFCRKEGHAVKKIGLPHNKYSVAAYYILTTAEASANLARFDGVRYGARSKQSHSLQAMYVNSREEGFGAEVKRRIMLGTYVLSAGYYDAYYRKAQKVRRLIKQDYDRAFNEVDLILMPTTPTTAFKLGEKINDPLQMYLNDVFTTSANLAGIPAMNIPVGFDEDGLPIGLQILSDQFQEAKIFRLAYSIEKYFLKND